MRQQTTDNIWLAEWIKVIAFKFTFKTGPPVNYKLCIHRQLSLVRLLVRTLGQLNSLASSESADQWTAGWLLSKIILVDKLKKKKTNREYWVPQQAKQSANVGQ